MLKDAIVEICDDQFLTSQDMDLLFKTHDHLMNREILSRHDLNVVFSPTYSEAVSEVKRRRQERKE
jgi:hypothetical protein